MRIHHHSALGLLARAAVAVTAITSLITLSACSGSTSSEESSTGPVTISYLSWQNEETARPVIDQFEAENPDIHIDFSYAPPVSEYVQTLQTRIAGNQAPDVFRIAPENRAPLIAEGLVRDLSDQPYVAELADANKAAYTEDGKLYGASFAAWEAGVFYNKKLLAEVGATEVPDTWDEFIDLSKKLKENGTTPYLETITDIPRIFQAFLGNQYAQAGTPEGERAIFDGRTTFAQEWPAALTEWHRLYDEGLVGAEAVSLTGDQVRDEFISGNVAMIVTGPWDLQPIADAGVDFGIDFTPGLAPGQTFGNGASEPGFAISSSSEGRRLDAAQKFIQWMASKEGLAAQAEHFGSYSTSSAYSAQVPEQYQEIYEQGLRQSRFYLCMEHWPRGADALLVEAQAQIQQYVQGGVTAEQVAQAMDAKLASLS